ncbi:cyclin-L2-like [Hydractinia symbiolongicarpus]|uniref:cyclin-L2-like n=1 Tax=Hydractinia symbiolongicarpus TaxID=13093 RepID=UPI002549D956|nr:cyclin-L2-like [Hydractinia symbiolongicarpus]
MAAPVVTKRIQKERDYDNIIISLENCILPSENLDETPSMKDGLDRDTENELRIFGCELIQTAGLLLRLPQVAMATGQVLLQRFYYTKSLVKHEVEVSAMAAIFLAAKIEESPRRIRDVINVYEHVKQNMLKKPCVPMDFLGNHYYNLKNAVIKAERIILKVLGFCVHVKHPHKIIITYLQILDLEKNANLARTAWNYMNDGLRTDVFVRFSPDIIACACIFLAARTIKINLPLRPPWWQLFDAPYEDIEDIALSILRLYSKPKVDITRLEAQVNKIRKAKEQEKKSSEAKESESTEGSFTPSHNISTNEPAPNAVNNNNSSKPSSKTNSPTEKTTEKRAVLSSVISSKKDDSNDRKRESYKYNRRRERSESEESSDYSSDSEAELPSKKYTQQRKQYEKKKRSPSSDSGNDRRAVVPSKIRRAASPIDNYRKSKSSRDKSSYKESNGHYNKSSYTKSKRRSRSRSPVKHGRSPSPSRKDKYLKSRAKEKIRSKDKNGSSKIRR